MGDNNLNKVVDIIRTGTVPYRYEFDTVSGLAFGGAVLFVIFCFAFFQAVTTKILN